MKSNKWVSVTDSLPTHYKEVETLYLNKETYEIKSGLDRFDLKYNTWRAAPGSYWGKLYKIICWRDIDD